MPSGTVIAGLLGVGIAIGIAFDVAIAFLGAMARADAYARMGNAQQVYGH